MQSHINLQQPYVCLFVFFFTIYMPWHVLHTITRKINNFHRVLSYNYWLPPKVEGVKQHRQAGAQDPVQLLIRLPKENKVQKSPIEEKKMTTMYWEKKGKECVVSLNCCLVDRKRNSGLEQTPLKLTITCWTASTSEHSNNKSLFYLEI